MKKFISRILLSCVVLGAVLSSCSVEPTYYSEVTPETFLQSQNAVWQRFLAPFLQWSALRAHTTYYMRLQEFGTDEMCIPVRGTEWYNNGKYITFHHHTYNDGMGAIEQGWEWNMKAVALCWDVIEELEEVDLGALGFPSGTIENMRAQINVIAAESYYYILDIFGGAPLYTTNKCDAKARATDEETFEFIDSLLTAAIPYLDVKETLGEYETSTIHQAAAAAIKARLYFNAEAYIGKAMYSEAAEICQDIIDGKYGKYALEDDFRDVFGFGNEYSTETIMNIPSANNKCNYDGGCKFQGNHYNYYQYLGGLTAKSIDNGFGLVPSRDPEGNLYHFNLGTGPYEKFNDLDARKKNYWYDSDGNYEGMFVIGELRNRKDSSWVVTGLHEYMNEPIVMVDQVARFSEVGTKYDSVADLVSSIENGEENSCVRIHKLSPYPDAYDSSLMYDPDIPFIRLAEMYYILAECKMRAGDLNGACELINTVRKRNFFTEESPRGAKTMIDDPDPVTPANLDKYRMLDEWMVEFIGECRRHTDLVRWDCYVTEEWWDHEVDGDPNHNKFPIYETTLSANPLLVQNPGY